MSYLYLAAFIAGLLLAVRAMFFGAERRKIAARDAMPLRRSEPAAIAFLFMFGVAGYLLARHTTLSSLAGAGLAVLLGLAWSAIATRIAVAMARMKPEHDPDDPRYALQGHVALVSVAIPPGGEGAITFSEGGASRTIPARAVDDDAIVEGDEVCIERLDDGVAVVERWALVEQRL